MKIGDSKSDLSVPKKEKTNLAKINIMENNNNYVGKWKQINDKPNKSDLSIVNDIKGELQQMPLWKPIKPLKKDSLKVVNTDMKQTKTQIQRIDFNGVQGILDVYRLTYS
jgi:hypothetical protein